MALNFSYPKDKFETEVEEAFRSLYTERNGEFVLTGIAGVKTQADVDRVQASLTAEREAHKKTKDRLRPLQLNGHSIVEMGDDELKAVVEAFDGYDELKTKAESAGKVDDGKINELVEQRIKAKLAPVERELKTTKDELTATKAKVTEYETAETTRTIHDAVRKARIASKVIDTAEEDVLMLAERVFEVSAEGKIITKDKVGCTPGVEPDIWLQEMQEKRAHWWPESQGGGAKGGKPGTPAADNPWLPKSWNLTKQGEVIRTLGETKAEQMAKAAGSFIGATAPAKSN